MKPYVFGIGVLLMLASSLAGMTYIFAAGLRHTSYRSSRLMPFATGAMALFLLIAALAWSVPAGEVV